MIDLSFNMTKNMDDDIAIEEAKIQRLRIQLAVANAKLKVMIESRRLIRGEKVPSKPKPSIADMVEDILRRAGKPMHMDDLLKALHKRGNNAAKETVTTAVWRFAKQGRRFRNTAPNTFELLK